MKNTLKRIRRIISNGWCREADARTARGQSVPRNSPCATRFDLASACYKATRGKPEAVMALLAHVAGIKAYDGDHEYALTCYNDAVESRREILDLLDKAIHEWSDATTGR